MVLVLRWSLAVFPFFSLTNVIFDVLSPLQAL